MAKEIPKSGPRSLLAGSQEAANDNEEQVTGKILEFKKALVALKTGGKQKTPTVELADQEIENPEQAHRNLLEALQMVKNFFGSRLKINLTDLKFKQFAGDQVGESTPSATYVDPKMVMHPVMRLAHVIAHELAHKNKSVRSEALVEAYVGSFFGKHNVEHKYHEAVAKFEKLAALCDKNGDVKKITMKMYDLYSKAKYEDIYQIYNKNHIANLKSEEEKDEAFKLFGEVFPELHYVRSGDFEMRRPRADVIDLASVRNRVKATEQAVRNGA